MSLINDSNKVRQVIDFTGVQNGKMHPSDIDAVLEFDNRILILMEVKYKYSPIPKGQKILLERICDAWQTDEREGIVLKIEHDFENSEVNVPLDRCFITGRYYKKEWKWFKKPKEFITYINILGEEWDCKKCQF